MGLIEYIAQHLGNIKAIPGVENVVLTQKDGVPIKSAGVWFSKDEVFKVCSATSAIYAVAKRLHPTLNHVLLEGDGAKIFIAPISTSTDYYMAVTTQAKVNLGHVFMRMGQSVTAMRNLLENADQDIIAPLRTFSEEERDEIQNSFQLKPESEGFHDFSDVNFQITTDFIDHLDQSLRNLVRLLPGVLSSSIILQGGYMLSNINVASDNYAAMVFSLYDTARRLAWIVKNMFVTQVLCASGHINHVIYEVDNALLSTTLDQKQVRLGLTRLLIGGILKEINRTIQSAPPKTRPSLKLDAPLVFNPQIRGTIL